MSQFSAEQAAPDSARLFLWQAALWNVLLFGVIRLAWVDHHVISRLIDFQETVVFWYGSTPSSSILVNTSCSGADVMALCAGVLLAYPLPWRRRIAGAALGVGLLLSLNALRIASLYYVVSTPATLNLLHVYVWPAILTVITLVYVALWIRWQQPATPHAGGRWIRFGLSAAGALVLYVAVVPWVFTSPAVLTVGAWTASAAAMLMMGLGTTVHAAGPLLVTSRGTFQVTQECLFTPTIPLYFAAVSSLPLSRRARSGWLALALPIFLALGILRLLVLALPSQIASAPVFLAHGFYQLLAGAVLIIGAAHLSARHASARHASRRTAIALAVAILAGMAATTAWQPALLGSASLLQALLPSTLISLTLPGDAQGALAFLPAFQIGLLAGLWLALTGGRRAGELGATILVLAVFQLAFLAAVGTAALHHGISPHALVVRGWALALPGLLSLMWVVPVEGTGLGDDSYQRFWNGVGESFPSLSGAASTRYYFESEKRLITEALPTLSGCVLLKTDLWDEAKNTHILQWAAEQGAQVYGIDLSEPIVREARTAFATRPMRPTVADVRQLPFRDDTFDAIYSMGTIEHFVETEASVVEIARVLKPGGRLILGVPNRHHPFLRPLLVAALNRLGLYTYGYEKSYSRRALRHMIESAGLDVGLESGILFIPGSLRMLDLWCHTRARGLAPITAALLRPFVWLDWRIRALRRHGYLLAAVGVKRRRRSPPEG